MRYFVAPVYRTWGTAMSKNDPVLVVTSDFTGQFDKIAHGFKKDMVLVGIPETDATRQDDAYINNAALLAINEFGSPANNIPARPVMSIGIKSVLGELADAFEEAAKAALQGYAPLHVQLNRIGMIASNAIKKAINAQIGIEPPSESTLRSRKSKNFKGTKALIVTGQLRNAITYVVKGEDE